MTRGGRRRGAGRPRGTGTGRTVKPVMFHLTPETIAAIDAYRGDMTRSQWVSRAVLGARAWPETVTVGGLVYWRTGKHGSRADTGIASAEYDRDGERVWLDATGVVHDE